jgi:predicted nucleotidyltransferase
MMNLTYSREQLEELCRRYHVSKLSVFGSTLRGEAGPDSDLDLLVEFEAGKKPGLDYFDLQDGLAAIFGRVVDLNTPEFINHRFRQTVMHEAAMLYANS